MKTDNKKPRRKSLNQIFKEQAEYFTRLRDDHNTLLELLKELRDAVSFLDAVDTRTAKANSKLNYFLNKLEVK